MNSDFNKIKESLAKFPFKLAHLIRQLLRVSKAFCTLDSTRGDHT